MIVRVADPLPECELCDRPTLRTAWEENGRLCTVCARGLADTVRMVPLRRADVVALDDVRRQRLQRETADAETVFVERYLPPVPGQLELPEQYKLDDEGEMFE